MAPKKAKAGERIRVFTDPQNETHMQVFERLARVKNMHGAPGNRPGSRGK